jgi:hypothetical protein
VRRVDEEVRRHGLDAVHIEYVEAAPRSAEAVSARSNLAMREVPWYSDGVHPSTTRLDPRLLIAA